MFMNIFLLQHDSHQVKISATETVRCIKHHFKERKIHFKRHDLICSPFDVHVYINKICSKHVV